MSLTAEPQKDCALCDRLVEYRRENIRLHDNWFNGAVPSFGADDAQFLIVGLAPGLQGANKTGRPFTGDYAGDLLYGTLLAYGFAQGSYESRADDGLQLVDCMITNAVRCVPPANKPIGAEITNCRPFLKDRIATLPNLQVILALGRIAHESVITAFGQKKAAFPFKHGAAHLISDGLRLYDSYHCSRYNTNTGRLTENMFHGVFADIRAYMAD